MAGAFAKLFLNEGAEAGVVDAPAFSITKVMAVVAPLITAVVALVTSALEDVSFTSSQIVTLIVALIAFLAVTASADVLARGIATSAEKSAAARGRWVTFTRPLSATLALQGKDETVSVLAASDAVPPEFLCVRADKSLRWEKSSELTIG